MKPPEILLIDDEPSLRKLMGTYLAHGGYHVEGVATGAEALAALEAKGGKFALVVMDLTLPDIQGSELVAHVTRKYPKLPILICSGLPFSVAHLPSHVRFLHKPFLPRMLAGEVQTMIGPPPKNVTGGGA